MPRRRARLCECGRPIVTWRYRKTRVHGLVGGGGRDHDLCQKCWKAYKDSERAITTKGGADARR